MSTSLLSDADLLDRFSREQDDDAFAELVRRHVGWVHSTSVRLMFGDSFAAEEVTQDVFTDLARKSVHLAREVRGGKPLVGWLHSGTRLAASNYRRAYVRRIARELQARGRNEVDLMNSYSADYPGWEEIRPLIDEALAELSPPNRDAVLMRFFEQRDLRSIGGVLGVSEDAARKRVDRALDRLRDWMESRGVRTTAAVLVSAVMAHGVEPLPVGITERIASKALLSHAGVASGLSARWNWIAMVGAVIVGLISWSAYQRSHSPEQPMTEVASVQQVDSSFRQSRSVGSVKSTVSAPVAGSKAIQTLRIPKRFLERFSFQSVVMPNSSDRRFVPSKRFVSVFRLTPAEVEGVVAAMDKALHTYRTIEGQRLTPTTAPEPNEFVPSPPPPPPGSPLSRMVVLEQRHFTLKPFPEEALAIHQEMETDIVSTLGTQRGAAFLRMAQGLKGEMSTFERSQMIGGVSAQLAVSTVFTYRLVQLDQGPIVDLEQTTSPGNFQVSPYGEELYRYAPEEMKSDLARWREYIREKGSTYFEWAAAMREPGQDPPMGSSEVATDLGPWDDESLTVEIPKEWLSMLGIAGLGPGEVISPDAIELCGLTEAETSLTSKIYGQMQVKFLDLERQHFVRTSSNSLEFVLHAFPQENTALHAEFVQSLRSLLGVGRGEMLYALIRTPISMSTFAEWMRKSVNARSAHEFLEQMGGKRWMDRGNDEIQIKLVQAGAGWKLEHRSLTDPKDVGSGATLDWNRVPLRWRHLLTPDMVERAVLQPHEREDGNGERVPTNRANRHE